MGKLVEETELPPLPPDNSYHFAAVEISARAIDRASQVIPEEAWKAVGLHTWLSARANAAFQKLRVGQYEITNASGRLKYVFEPVRDKPVLKTIVLL